MQSVATIASLQELVLLDSLALFNMLPLKPLVCVQLLTTTTTINNHNHCGKPKNILLLEIVGCG